MKNLHILLYLFVIFGNQIVQGEIPERITDLYDFAYDSYLNENIGKSDFDETIDQILVEISKHPNLDEALYWKSKSLYLRGIAEIKYGNEKSGELHLNEAVMAAQALRSTSPEQSYCLEADAKAQIMLIKGVSYIIRKGGEVQKLAEMTLELNPDNAVAALIIARRRINVPGLFGGAPKKGIEILQDILDRANGDLVLGSPERFRFYMALGRAYEKIKQKDKARSAYEDALYLYPGNSSAIENLNDL